jgi:ABC-type Fe3+/spermidine/putrescine transport system ATPase subunit
MSDRIAVMSHGRVAQVGTPTRIFERPDSALVAEFMGAANFFAATMVASGPGLLRLRLAHGAELSVPMPDDGGLFRSGESVRFLVRPEKLVLRPSAPADPAHAAVPVTIEDRIYQGASTQWIVRAQNGERLVVLEQNSVPLDGLPALDPGTAAFACWDPAHTVIVRED